MQKLGGGHSWLSEDAPVNISDPFVGEIEVDDWLTPSFNAQQDAAFANDFISPLEGYPGEKALDNPPSPSISEELDNFFEQPVQRVTSMRTAFSMNDLQSLQSSATTAPTWSHRNHVSVKPSLSSVPEGGPAQEGVQLMPISGLYNPNDFQACSLFHDELDFLSSEPAAGSINTSMSTADGALSKTADPAYFPKPNPLGFHQFTNEMQISGRQTTPTPMGSLFQQQSFANSAMTAPGMPATLLPSMSAIQPMKPDLPISLGFMAMQAESPEHQMTEAVKVEPGCDTDSSGQTAEHAKAQPSGAALRKSHSALELGAWRKMAAGDLDFVDPSGSVREKLQGLDSYHIGKLTPEERLQKILRYRAKRQMRNFNRTIKYQCRKSLADTRPRVRGRFARDNEPGSVLPHETKKAMRQKTPRGKSGQSPPSPDEQEQPDALMGPAIKMEQDHEQQGLARQYPAKDAPGSAAAVNFAQQPDRQPATGLSEHHATALAHLYNQWSEADMQLQQKATTVRTLSNNTA